MNWDALGAISEIIGAVAVLVTLFYLAAQIKMQNRELEKSNENVTAQLSVDLNNVFINNFDALMRDKEFVEIYLKGMSNQPLDEIEIIQFSIFVNRWLAFCETLIVTAKADVAFTSNYDLDVIYVNP